MSTIQAQQRSFRPWIIAIVATVAIIAATLLGLRAFNTTAHAEGETPAQSAQSDSTTQSGSQSGDTPQSAEPTPISVPKPTPPPHLYAGGQIGAQATSQWYLDLWTYAFNTGDTEDFMKVCQVAGYCDEFAHDLELMHTDSYLVTPLTNKYLQTKTYTSVHSKRPALKEFVSNSPICKRRRHSVPQRQRRLQNNTEP